MSRTPLMQRLLSLTKATHQSKKRGIPVKEFAEQVDYSRRNFLQTSGKAALAASLFIGCSKLANQPSVPSNPQPNIVIIGAGIAGLNAAYTLKKAGITSSVYEASSRVGGRIFTAQNILNEGLSTELGGEFIDSGHKDMQNLANEFGLELIDLFSPSELTLNQNLYYFKGVAYTDNDFLNAISDYIPFIENDANSLSNVIKYNSYSPVDKKFDNMNLYQYFDSINLNGWLRSLLLVAYIGEYGLGASECSAINFLYLFGNSPEGNIALYGQSNERYKIKGGNQKITDALADNLKENIYTEHKLVKLQNKGKGFELFFENNIKAVKADIVLLTLPFALLREVELDIELTPVKRRAIFQLGYGNNSKLLLGFNGRPWRTRFNGVGMSYSDNGTQNTWDNSQLQPGSNGGLTIYLGADDAVKLGNSTADHQADKYLELLNQLYPGVKNDYNNKAYTMIWPTYPYTKGSYSSWKVGQYTTIAGSEIETIGNLFFAGEHTSYNFQGFMNGGAITGRKAAENIAKKIH